MYDVDIKSRFTFKCLARIAMVIITNDMGELDERVMRRNFAQVLKSGKIDIKNEYDKIYKLFYGKDTRDQKSIAEIVSNHFLEYDFRGTCLTFEEFNKRHGFNFEVKPQTYNEMEFVRFIEYVYNLIYFLNSRLLFHDMGKYFYLNHIESVVEEIGYMSAYDDGFTIFIPKDNNVIAVAESEVIPDNLSYKLLEYNHHSMKGNIEAKREILVKLADVLESHDKKLNGINQTFKSDLFQLLNSCNIRHNNKEKSSKQYKKYISELSDTELERIYDEIYQMCLLAFMQLEHADRKDWMDEIKRNINNAK